MPQQKPEPKPSKFTAYAQNPYVGYLGSGLTLGIRRSRHKIVCSRSVSTFIFLLLGFVLFGPLTFWMIFVNEESHRQFFSHPWWIQALVFLLLGIGDIAFIQMLIKNPYIIIDQNKREIHFKLSWFTEKPQFVLRADEIDHLETFITDYSSENLSKVPNYGLVLVTKFHGPLTLCLSCKQSQIELLTTAIADTFAVPAELTWRVAPNHFYAKPNETTEDETL